MKPTTLYALLHGRCASRCRRGPNSGPAGLFGIADRICMGGGVGIAIPMPYFRTT
jgi:hypothetical protein